MEEDVPGTSGVQMPKENKSTMLDQVCTAIKTVGLQRKGASLQAIKKYILSSYEESEHVKVNNRIKKVLVKGIADGVLVRPKVSENSTGASGRFMLAKTASKGKSETKTSKTEAQEPDGKTAKAPKTKKIRDSLDGTEKAVKKVSKPKATVSKAVKPKLAVSKKNGTKTVAKKNEARKDASDSEVVIKKKVRKSLKSYSSDTELNVTFTETKTEKAVEKKTKKPKATVSKAAKAEKVKLFNPEKEEKKKAAKKK